MKNNKIVDSFRSWFVKIMGENRKEEIDTSVMNSSDVKVFSDQVEEAIANINTIIGLKYSIDVWYEVVYGLYEVPEMNTEVKFPKLSGANDEQAAYAVMGMISEQKRLIAELHIEIERLSQNIVSDVVDPKEMFCEVLPKLYDNAVGEKRKQALGFVSDVLRRHLVIQ